ncbi:AhpC/TSA family protein [Polaribacter pectinis]|uniref:AhpC/TSA family protein n=1 Tax=Polaribacter pectinis TaxID=2738844 RepID=A0A7G9L7G9_9FLAO|nr:TlpA disulfide reductase family protein [Polaribacter pectinis]QNM84568.1 AhpC/TSA family protein [Polaribacter pectinis]
MKLKNLTLGLILFVIFISCEITEDKNYFVLKGTVTNAKDSETILLRINNKNVDSTILKNDRFTFKGKLDKPTRVFLIIKNSRDYKSFWLENKIIDVYGTRGKLKDGEVQGSNTQKEADLLNKKLKKTKPKLLAISNTLMTISKNDIRKDSLSKLLWEYETEFAQINQDFIVENPNSLISLEILTDYKRQWGKKTTSELYDKLSSKNKNSKEGLQIYDYLNAKTNPKIGEKYIDFEQPDKNGKLIKVSDILSKFTLIEFWSSNCGPCRVANPKLVKIYKEFHNKGFEIIGVSHNRSKDHWLEAIKKDKLPWINVSELNGNENNAANIYGVTAIPDNVLIDEEGVIVARKIKAVELEFFLEKEFKYSMNRLY